MRDVAELSNLYASSDLTPGVPVQHAQLTTDSRAGFTIPVTKGKRAVTIEVDGPSGIEGRVSPGKCVDVVLTAVEAGRTSATIVVQNACILSLGGDLSAGNNPAVPAAVLTVQTAGEALNFHPHLHGCIADGLFALVPRPGNLFTYRKRNACGTSRGGAINHNLVLLREILHLFLMEKTYWLEH